MKKENRFKTKKEARVYFRKSRQTNFLKVERLIINQVENQIKHVSKANNQDSIIGIYWPINGEVDLRDLKKSLKLSLALPACNDKGEISYHQWTDAPLEKDSYGILSPLSEPALKSEQLKLLLVPALAMDHYGTRLGYGGGCFDRLRAKKSWKAIKALAILPSACISNIALPIDPWDVPFDGWINENETFQINHLDC